MGISLDQTLQTLAEEQKHTELNFKIFSSLFKDLGPLISVVRISEQMLEDQNAEDIIRYRINQMTDELIDTMKKQKLLNSKGEILK